MSIRSAIVFCCMLLGSSLGAAAVAGSGASHGHAATDQAQYHLLPVAMTVNGHDRISQMNPPFPLSNAQSRELKHFVDELIASGEVPESAMKTGRMVVILAARTTSRSHGKSAVKLSYVRAKPLLATSQPWLWQPVATKQKLTLIPPTDAFTIPVLDNVRHKNVRSRSHPPLPDTKPAMANEH